MSLQERFRDGLLDAKGKPRLTYARSYFFDYSVELDFDELQQFYCDWRDFDEYVVLHKQTESLRIQGEIEKETIAIKCSKHGNDVYWWRIRKRLKFLNELMDHTFFDVRGNVKYSNVLFVTLTYEIKRSSIQEAWETIGDDFNKWIRNIRKKFGRISYLQCWEASRKGYSHIHVLMFFHDHQFRIAFSHLQRKRRVYRIEVKTQTSESAGATETTKNKQKEKIFEYAWWLKKQGYAEVTIKGRVKLLKVLVKRGANLYDTESVKSVITQHSWSQARKNLAVVAYASFLKMVGGSWDPPTYRRVKKLPFVPMEEEIDQVIAGCNKKTATFLQLLKETGMRSGEAWRLQWIDLDFKKRAVRVIPEKNGEPRELPISNTLIAMLKLLPKTSEKVFGNKILVHFSRNFRKQRLRISHKLQNPRQRTTRK